MKLLAHLLTCVILGTIAALVIQHPVALITCPPIGYGSACLWFPEERWWIKRLWRKLRGRCPMCGGPWTKKAKNPLDIYSYAPVCRSCAKVLLAGRLYGMGDRKLSDNCERLYKGVKSFLDGVTIPPGCPLVCHDANHNGDDHPGRPCGNPKCWKHGPNAPPPKWMTPRDPRCTCEFGTK